MLQLRLSNFNVVYHGIPAVMDLSLTLSAATVNFVTGVIGAGKSSLLKALSGTVGHTGDMQLQEGSEVFGRGAMLQPISQSLVNPFMTVSQFLRLGLAQNSWTMPANANDRIADALNRCRLGDLANTPISVLTAEQFRLAEIAQLFVQQPRVILLDEPARQLSPESTSSVLTCISKWVHDTRSIALLAAEQCPSTADIDRIIKLENGRLMTA